jgi:Tfp pilus assembly protein PilF
MKIRYIIVFTLIILAFASCEDDAVIIRKELNAGVEVLYRGQYTQALHHFRKVLEIDSTQAEAHHYLGLVYFNQQKFDMAMYEFNRAILFDANFGEAYKSRAQLWSRIDKRNKACKDYLKAESLGVKNLSNYTSKCRDAQSRK